MSMSRQSLAIEPRVQTNGECAIMWSDRELSPVDGDGVAYRSPSCRSTIGNVARLPSVNERDIRDVPEFDRAALTVASRILRRMRTA
jgi:hypothetical protein